MTVINIFQAVLHVKLIKRYGTSRKFLIDLFDNVMFIFELFFFFIISLKHQTYRRCIYNCHTSCGVNTSCYKEEKTFVTFNNVFMTDQSIQHTKEKSLDYYSLFSFINKNKNKAINATSLFFAQLDFLLNKQ